MMPFRTVKRLDVRLVVWIFTTLGLLSLLATDYCYESGKSAAATQVTMIIMYLWKYWRISQAWCRLNLLISSTRYLATTRPSTACGSEQNEQTPMEMSHATQVNQSLEMLQTRSEDHRNAVAHIHYMYDTFDVSRRFHDVDSTRRPCIGKEVSVEPWHEHNLHRTSQSMMLHDCCTTGRLRVSTNSHELCRCTPDMNAWWAVSLVSAMPFSRVGWCSILPVRIVRTTNFINTLRMHFYDHLLSWIWPRVSKSQDLCTLDIIRRAALVMPQKCAKAAVKYQLVK